MRSVDFSFGLSGERNAMLLPEVATLSVRIPKRDGNGKGKSRSESGHFGLEAAGRAAIMSGTGGAALGQRSRPCGAALPRRIKGTHMSNRCRLPAEKGELLSFHADLKEILDLVEYRKSLLDSNDPDELVQEKLTKLGFLLARREADLSAALGRPEGEATPSTPRDPSFHYMYAIDFYLAPFGGEVFEPALARTITRLEYVIFVVERQLENILGGQSDGTEGKVRQQTTCERSAPMSLVEMANRVDNIDAKAFKRIAKRKWGLKRLGRKTWTVRVDLMDKNTRRKIELSR